MKKRLNYHRGFSLIEIILAVSIFGLSITGLFGGLIYGAEASLAASYRGQAVFVAQEGIEALKNISAENFNNLIDGSYGLVVVGNFYVLSGAPDIQDIYERQINISSINANTKKVESSVSWSENVINEGEVILTAYIVDWK